MQLQEASVDFLNGYFSTHHRSERTKVAYKFDLALFLSFAGSGLDLVALNGETIERWAAHLRAEGYAPASIKRKIVALRVFCSYWVRKGPLPESPFWRVKISFGRIEQLPRALTRQEAQSLLTQARQQQSTLVDEPQPGGIVRDSVLRPFVIYRATRNSALVDLLFATGMRVGEVSSLDIKDFSAGEGIFKVQGKGGRDRLAFIVDKKTIQIQREHLKARRRIDTDCPALFLNPAGQRLSTQAIAGVIAGLRRDARIERHITPHMLRHTVATLLLRNGADIRVVQEFLGHASISTTQRYTHVSKEHLVGVLRKCHPSLNLRRTPAASDLAVL
jgi:integrase/recombinase XerD